MEEEDRGAYLHVRVECSCVHNERRLDIHSWDGEEGGGDMERTTVRKYARNTSGNVRHGVQSLQERKVRTCSEFNSYSAGVV